MIVSLLIFNNTLFIDLNPNLIMCHSHDNVAKTKELLRKIEGVRDFNPS